LHRRCQTLGDAAEVSRLGRLVVSPARTGLAPPRLWGIPQNPYAPAVGVEVEDVDLLGVHVCVRPVGTIRGQLDKDAAWVSSAKTSRISPVPHEPVGEQVLEQRDLVEIRRRTSNARRSVSTSGCSAAAGSSQSDRGSHQVASGGTREESRSRRRSRGAKASGTCGVDRTHLPEQPQDVGLAPLLDDLPALDPEDGDAGHHERFPGWRDALEAAEVGADRAPARADLVALGNEIVYRPPEVRERVQRREAGLEVRVESDGGLPAK
jgi:hypothetical protein